MKTYIIKRLITLVIIPVLCMTQAFANDNTQSLSLKDFAYGSLLEQEGEGAIYRFTLSEDIYRTVTRSDLGDIRVFNNAGEVVPHAIRQPESPSATKSEPLPLPFFPLYEAKGKQAEALSLYFTTNNEGVILKANTVPANHASAVVNAYLVDVSAFKRVIDQLHLEWSESSGSFVTTVRVESSNDLTHWRSLVRKATLAELHYSGHNLGQHTISLPFKETLHSGQPKYLRISWNAGKEGTRLIGIKAIFTPLTPEPVRQQIQVTGKTVSDKPVVYEFNTRGYFPVDRVNLILPQKNSLIQGVLKSRADTKTDKWHVHYQGIFYHLQVDGATLSNNIIQLSRTTTDQYWQLDISPAGGDPGGGLPILELGWIPHDFLFLARGNPPFQLAYGSTSVKNPPGRPINILLNAMHQDQKGKLIKTAQMGERSELGGEALLKPLKPAFPWRQFLLWSVLISGVFLLGWMAWRLYQQMGEEGKD